MVLESCSQSYFCMGLHGLSLKTFSSLVLFEHRQVLFAWQPSGNYVASIGEGSRNLFLFDRRGVQVEEVTLKSTAKVTQLEWDKDGEILAILQQKEDWTVECLIGGFIFGQKYGEIEG